MLPAILAHVSAAHVIPDRVVDLATSRTLYSSGF
jgi:hypothetical protein